MSKNTRQRFYTGDVCRFLKSGNTVRLLEPHGTREWVVERTSGASKGKQMICRESALQQQVKADETQ
jgi:hypothetical protein